MLRQALLYLSRQRSLRRWVETSPVAQRLSRRFVAGSTLEQALAVCRRLQTEGITATLDCLGENVTALEHASSTRDTYMQMLATMREAGLEPNVSLKLTQFGLDVSLEHCRELVAELVAAAVSMGGFVRVDMESSQYTDRTLALVAELHERFEDCGTVIQAYLRRSEADIEALIASATRVRLCKGAYLEHGDVAFEAKSDVDANYVKLAKRLLAAGRYPAIATHDENIVRQLLAWVRENSIPKDAFEFQMLYGIRRGLQRRLVAEGYRVRVYVPFGEAWYPYFMRRLAERPANVFFLLRNLIRD